MGKERDEGRNKWIKNEERNKWELKEAKLQIHQKKKRTKCGTKQEQRRIGEVETREDNVLSDETQHDMVQVCTGALLSPRHDVGGIFYVHAANFVCLPIFRNCSIGSSDTPTWRRVTCVCVCVCSVSWLQNTRNLACKYLICNALHVSCGQSTQQCSVQNIRNLQQIQGHSTNATTIKWVRWFISLSERLHPIKLTSGIGSNMENMRPNRNSVSKYNFDDRNRPLPEPSSDCEWY
jgi:hypothetical protein